MRMPSEEEQAIAESYVLDRILYRPDTDVKKALKYVGAYILISNAIASLSFAVLSKLGIFSYLPEKLSLFHNNHSRLFLFLYFLMMFIITGIITLKKAVIGAIKLYQHYAPEQIRRRCLFKPTCSEYAILAVKKYGVIKGLYKAYIRLFKKCRGTIYGIDYP
jgi:putative membrane protein insertion efficiency factor